MKKLLFTLLLCCFAALIHAQVVVTIGVNGPLVGPPQDTVILCGIDDDVTLVGWATGGTAPYIYTWIDPSGQTVPTADDSIAIFTSASYGTYKVYCQAQGVSGPAGLDSIIVVVGKVPQLTYPLNQTICKGSCVNLNCSTSGAQGGNLLVWYLSNEGGTIEAATYGTSPFSLPYNACPNFTTNYWATAYDTSTGCSKSKEVKVTVSTVFATAKANPGFICIGNQSHLSVVITGNGTPPYTYSWSPIAGLSNPNISNPIATPGIPTIYCVTVTDKNGCSAESCVTVNLPMAPVIKDDTTICHGGCATLTVDTVGTYAHFFQWSSTPKDTISIVVCPPATTIYTVTVTEGGTCTASASATVTVSTPVVAHAGAATQICSLACVTIGGAPTGSGGTPPYTYNWSSSPAGFSSNVADSLVCPTVNTTYYVTVTDALGCTDVDSVKINLFPQLIVNAGDDTTICSGSCVTIGWHPTASGGTPAYTYAWSPAAGLNFINISNPTACVAAPATYTVTVTDAHGCSASSDVVLSISPLPLVYNVTGGDTLICPSTGITIGLDNSQVGISYILVLNGIPPYLDTVNGTGAAITFGIYSIPGIYTVIGFDPATGCSIQMADSAMITNFPLPPLSITGPDTMCAGIGGNKYYTPNQPGMVGFIWHTSAGGIITDTVSPDTVLVKWAISGKQAISVTYTYANGCQNTFIDSVFVRPLTVPTITGPAGVCTATSGNIYGTQSGMSDYVWSISGGTIDIGQGTDTVSVTWNTSGVDTLWVDYTDIHGCSDTVATMYLVTVAPLAVAPTSVKVDTNNFCYGAVATITLTAIGGSGTTLNWYSGSCVGGVYVGSGTPLIIPAPTTTTAYFASWANACDTSNCAVKVVIVNPLPVPSLSGPASVCVASTGNAYTTDPGMTNYIWSVTTGGDTTAGGSTSDNTITIKWTIPGNDTVRVNYTDPNGCTDSTFAIYYVRVNPLPVPVITGPNTVCVGSTVIYGTDTAMNAYTWSTSAGGSIISGLWTDSITVTWNTAGPQWVNIFYTDSNGCTDTLPTIYNVTVDTVPTVFNVTGGGIICANDSALIGLDSSQTGMTYNLIYFGPGSIVGTHVGTNSPFSFGYYSSLGTYIVVASNGATGCNDTMNGSAIIIVNPLPIPTITGIDTACYGTIGDIYKTDTGMTNYVWTVIGGTITAGGLATSDSVVVTWNTIGNDTVKVNYTDSNGCKAATATIFKVKVFPLPVPTITGSSAVCAGTTGNIYSTDIGMTGYNWYVSSGGSIISGSGTDSITVTWNTAGSDMVTVNYINKHGCTDTVSTIYIVTVNPLPIKYNVTGSATICASDSAQICLSNSQPGVSYTLILNAGPSEGNINGTGLPKCFGYYSLPGTYIVVATDNITMCSDTMNGSVIIIVNPLPIPTLTGIDTACYGTTGDIYKTDTGMTGYVWTVIGGTITAGGTATSDSVVVTWNTVGSDTVKVNYTDSNGCKALSPTIHVVIVYPLPVPIITGPNPVCEGSSGIYSAQTGMSGYIWNISGGTIIVGSGTDSITVKWDSVGTDTIWVNYIDTHGCTDTVSAIYLVTVNPLPIKFNVTGSATICASDSAQICLDSSQVGVTYNLILNAGSSVGNFNGSGFSKCFGYYPLPGTYIVIATDDITGCSDTMNGSAIIIVNPLPIPTLTGIDTACYGTTGDIYRTDTGMSNYVWTVVGGNITAGGTATSDSVVVTWNTVGSDTVEVNYTNSNGCTALSPTIYVVKVYPLPVPTITGPSPVCAGTSGNIYTTDTGMTGYIWKISGGTIIAGTGTDSINVTWNIPGTDTLWVNYIDSHGCSDIVFVSYIVTVDPLPVAPTLAKVDTNNFCQGTVGNIILTSAGGSGTILNWYSGSCIGVYVGSGTPLTIPAPASTTTYYASWSNSCGSSSCDSITVVVYPLPTPIISGPASVCVGSTGNVYTTQAGMIGYTWNISAGGIITSGSATNSIKVTWNTVGAQTISVNDSNSFGCTATAPTVYNVAVHKLPVPAITGPDTVCAGTTNNIYSTHSGSNYIWTVSSGGTITAGGTTSDSTITITWDTAGAQTISVNFENSFGCADTVPFVYHETVNPLPEDSISFANTSSCAACDGSVLVIDKSSGSIPIATYLWSNGAITPSILDLCPNTYTVTVSTLSGCEKINSATVVASTDIAPLTIVNTFSPNGDGINDVWVIKNIELYPDNELTVINRWGNEVYHVKGYQNNWDGSNLSNGTYFYYLKVNMCGDDNSYKGYVTIVR